MDGSAQLQASAARNRKHAATLKIGDLVAFTRLFMQSGGGTERARWRGTIACEHGEHLVDVDWSHGETTMVNRFNLCKPRSVPFAE